MRLTRRVSAIVSLVAALVLTAGPAEADDCTGDCRARLIQVGVHGRVVQLVADGDSTCALTENGDVYCWGADYPDPYAPGRSPLLLIALGTLLLAGGTTLLLLSRR